MVITNRPAGISFATKSNDRPDRDTNPRNLVAEEMLPGI